MTHRAQQILDAAAAAHSARAELRAHIEVNRVRSLSEAQDELPALTINYGADTPDDSADLDSFRSVLDVELTSYCVADSEIEVLAQLLELRRQSHITIMADMTFGLAFVWHTAYGGAEKPIVRQADRTVGALTTHWLVRYINDISDPG